MFKQQDLRPDRHVKKSWWSRKKRRKFEGKPGSISGLTDSSQAWKRGPDSLEHVRAPSFPTNQGLDLKEEGGPAGYRLGSL